MTIDISKVRAGDVFVSRINHKARIRVRYVWDSSIDIVTLRADGTGIRARNITYGTLRENYREVTK